MANITFEILEQIAVLSTNDKGWQKELNLIAWNQRPAKFDLRDWSKNHSKMGKGVTLSNEELAKLRQALNEMIEN